MGDCLLSHRRGTARGDVRDLIRYTLTVASQRIAAVNATSDRPKSFAAAVPSSVPHNGECRYALGHLLVNQESNAARRSSEQPAPVAELVEPAEATSVSGQAASLLGSLPNIIFFSIWTAAYPPLIPPCGTPHAYVHGRAARCGALPHDEPALEPFQCANHRLFTAVRCTQCASYSWDTIGTPCGTVAQPRSCAFRRRAYSVSEVCWIVWIVLVGAPSRIGNQQSSIRSCRSQTRPIHSTGNSSCAPACMRACACAEAQPVRAV